MSNSIDFSNTDVSNQIISSINNSIKDVDLSIADMKSTDLSSFGQLYKNALAENVMDSGSDSSSFSPLSTFGSLMQGYNSISNYNSGTQSETAGAMQASNNAIDFIEQHEGFSPTAYSGIDSQNQTIGYGHVIQPGENISVLSNSQGTELLKKDLTQFEDSVNQEFAGVNLTQNQFDALVSFSYNTGANIWSKVPQLTSDIKSGASADVLKSDFAACSNCNGEFVQGLYNRRMDEWQMFTGGGN
jgi:GH24 family phage-related lysozyme (muramidase)